MPYSRICDALGPDGHADAVIKSIYKKHLSRGGVPAHYLGPE